jgi:hypothetical protein
MGLILIFKRIPMYQNMYYLDFVQISAQVDIMNF